MSDLSLAIAATCTPGPTTTSTPVPLPTGVTPGPQSPAPDAASVSVSVEISPLATVAPGSAPSTSTGADPSCLPGGGGAGGAPGGGLPATGLGDPFTPLLLALALVVAGAAALVTQARLASRRRARG